MIDIKLVRENPDLVKENMKKKFQHDKVQLVDKVLELDVKRRETIAKVDDLRASRNTLSKQIGKLMGQGQKEEAQDIKNQVAKMLKHLLNLNWTERAR